MSDIVVTRWIAASPGTVFAFFTDAERWNAWQGVGGKVDARAGGVLRVIMPDAAAASGQFLEVVPPRRIVFTWGWEGNGIPVPPGSSIVTVELEPADGGTMVRLTHSGLRPADYGSCIAAGGSATLAGWPTAQREKTLAQIASTTSSPITVRRDDS